MVNGIQGLFLQVSEQDDLTKEVFPSSIAFVAQKSGYQFEEPGITSIILSPDVESDEGVENPRVYFKADENTYYMYYTAKTDGKQYLSLATCNLNNGNLINSTACWHKRGLVFDNQTEAIRGASLLLRSSPPHYLYYHANKNIEVATTYDMIHYTKKSTLLTPTSGKYDSVFVESGPQPMPMSDGNFAFLYNSAQLSKFSSPKNGTVQYNIGFLVLDKEDPTKILYRHKSAILSPDLAWERCDSLSHNLDESVDYESLGRTPVSVGVSGWVPLKSQGGVDQYLAFYQGCDSSVGIFRFTLMAQADSIWDWILIILILIVLAICVVSCLAAIVGTLIFKFSPRSMLQAVKISDMVGKMNPKKKEQKNFLSL